ncbi:acyltransferase family protein [Pimelobacter simplex]|uniref:acyltransferase family protein n=1 Tax=Nocardioides simplex TaxID=2045 RepID=UPI0008E455CB|nr:acyltransferase [Pimelobacter simplex]MCG8151034.1 acyltransferase family protein [Pimelobacter simplex]GEB12334.1 acyltransferase [Pimelobacter simplex]SFM96398.1 Peptidoglycan/LPS O-acetylase OafA/YrhL, contains acyltransferase and SGNH-hydrolase domains [Pimelobacter simplex]
MRDEPIEGRDRLPSLTGLRFWAALLVVLYHLSRTVGQVPVVSDLSWYGRCGVTFFFVLSGFVLAWSYDGTRTRPLVFYWRRFARIWPLMAVAIVLSVAVYLALDVPVRRDGALAGLTFTNAWFTDPGIVVGGNPAVWSLSDEAFFYAVFPLLLLVLAPRRPCALLVVAGAGCAAALGLWLASGGIDLAHRSWALDYLPLSRLTQFVVGVAVALAMRRGWRPRIGLPVALVLVVAYLAALIPWHQAVPDTEWYGPYSASQLLSTPVFALLVAAAAQADLSGRRTGLTGTWMLRLGHWSFAWYLVHEIVIRWVRHQHPALYEGAGVLAVWTAVIVVSLALAGALYYLVEHPAERFLRRRGPQPAAREVTAPGRHRQMHVGGTTAGDG